MTHEQKRIWLINELLMEDSYYNGYGIPSQEQEQKDLLRALMNVRPPKPISQQFLQVQDEYLSEEVKKNGITESADLSATGFDRRISLWRGDITTLKVDGIVNAANSGMTGCYRPLHNCIDNIIHSKAGIQLRLKCHEIMQKQGFEEPTGSAKITPAYNLPCKYVLHTVGPIVQGNLTDSHRKQLKSCYTSCLELAETSGLQSIAFCNISTGVFMFPKREAAEIAIATVSEFLDGHDGIKKVIFNVFDIENYDIYRSLLE